METQIEKTLAALRSRHINGMYTEDSAEACRKILSLIPKELLSGWETPPASGNWGCCRPQGQRDERTQPIRCQQVGYNPRSRATTPGNNERGNRVRRVHDRDERDYPGWKLVNVDAVGNRVAGIFWGHPTSIVVVGRNKIVKDLDEAFRRIRTLIARSIFV